MAIDLEKTTKDGVPLLTLETAQHFYDSLEDEFKITAVDNCVSGEVAGLGYGVVRKGSDNWNKGLRHAVTTIIAKDVDLDEMAQNHIDAQSDYDSIVEPNYD